MRILGLYFRTVRFMKINQIFNRARRLIFKNRLTNIEDYLNVIAHNKEIIINFPSKSRSILQDNTFLFLNKKLRLRFPDDWRNKDIPLLWLYNLHYFDGLLDSSTPNSVKEDLINCWIRDNSQTIGIPWDPYPLSLRICNWIKWIWSHDGKLPPRIVASLFQQSTHLAKNLEFHLLGNHLLENAKALIFTGYFFGGSFGQKWLIQGLAILKKELNEQILEDGGHFELSTMYHSLVLELVLDILQLAGEKSAPKILAQEVEYLRKIASAMAEWLSIMSHPDQEISFFNDAAIGIAPSPRKLIHRANFLSAFKRVALKDKMHYLQNTGYIRMTNKDVVAFIDIAEVGASYIPGHGHADTLSFECSLFGNRLIVNSGSSEYGLSDQRDYERSTAAHSTLEINGLNSSEVWGGFRVGRRAHLSKVSIQDNFVSAQHNGYRFLKGSPTHKREFSLTRKQLLITDCIYGPFEWAKVYFHIHPSIRVLSIDDDRNGFFELPDGSKASWKSNAEHLSIQNNLYSQEFGRKLPNKTIVLKMKTNNETVFSINWD